MSRIGGGRWYLARRVSTWRTLEMCFYFFIIIFFSREFDVCFGTNCAQRVVGFEKDWNRVERKEERGRVRSKVLSKDLRLLDMR